MTMIIFFIWEILIKILPFAIPLFVLKEKNLRFLSKDIYDAMLIKFLHLKKSVGYIFTYYLKHT